MLLSDDGGNIVLHNWSDIITEGWQLYTKEKNLYKANLDRKMLTEYKNPNERQDSSLNIDTSSKYPSEK